jgi:hypothetical protein
MFFRDISLTPPFMGVLGHPHGKATVSTVSVCLGARAPLRETVKTVVSHSTSGNTPMNGVLMREEDEEERKMIGDP